MKVINNCIDMLKWIYISDKKRILFMISLSLISALKNLISVLFIKFALDCITIYGSFQYLLILVLVERLLSAGLSYFECLLQWEKCPVSDQVIKSYILKMVYDKSLKIGLSQLDEPKFYDKFTRAIDEAETRPAEIIATMESFLTSILTIFSVSTVLALLDWKLIALGFLSSIISVIANIMISKLDFRKNKDLTRSARKLGYVRRLFYLPQYIEEMKTNNYNQLLFAKQDSSAKEYTDQIRKYQPKSAFWDVIRNWQSFVINFGLAAIFIGQRIAKGAIELSSFTSMIYASTTLSGSLSGLFSVIPQMTKHALFISSLKEILDCESTMESYENPEKVQKAQSHAIALDHVSFRYAASKSDTLKNITMNINKGEKIALVGENGAGKSTLVKLILRLYDPDSGSLYFDGKNYKSLDVSSLRSEISIVYQHFQSFAFTIGENVLTRELQGAADEQAVWAALKASGLCSKIEKLPHKLQTPLTSEFEDHGVSLSGGENQKLAIAKAVHKDAGVIIMDEPSSSLDPISEQEMYLRLFHLCKDKTLILISHRLYSTKMVDKIYYMENGAIAECGSHEELIKRNGKYAHLYRIQAEQYK